MNCCSLCEKLYLSEEKFNIYLCYDCHKKTSFCMNCDKIMSKIFNYTNIFKCDSCNKVTPAISKQLVEMENQNDFNQFSNISTINETNENKLLLNNNFKFKTPKAHKIIFPLNVNKHSINTPPTYSSFFFDLENNTDFEKNEEKCNMSYLSGLNKSSKINRRFHLINGENRRDLLKDNKRNIFLEINKDKEKDKIK